MMHLAIAINDRNHTWISSLICIFTRAKAYHCELVFSNGCALSAFPNRGVVYEQKDFSDTYGWLLLPLYWISEIDELQIKKAAMKILETSEGYDYLGAVFGRFWHAAQDSNKWFCSELCAELLSPYTETIDIKKYWYSPGSLWESVSTKQMMDGFCVAQMLGECDD